MKSGERGVLRKMFSSKRKLSKWPFMFHSILDLKVTLFSSGLQPVCTISYAAHIPYSKQGWIDITQAIKGQGMLPL